MLRNYHVPGASKPAKCRISLAQTHLGRDRPVLRHRRWSAECTISSKLFFSASTLLANDDRPQAVSDTGDSNTEKVRSLKDALRKVRTAETERSDVVVELRDAERARLELLADELRGVFAEVPADDEQFIFTVAAGTPPRLWIDMTAFVVMGRDRRTYRFLKDTRLGRSIIVETAKLDDIADTITQYVAERIIERERAIEGDWLMKRVMRDEVDAPPGRARGPRRPGRGPPGRRPGHGHGAVREARDRQPRSRLGGRGVPRGHPDRRRGAVRLRLGQRRLG